MLRIPKMSLASFYTPDRIKQIFKELEITEQTDPIVAKNRIEAYLRVQKAKIAQSQGVAKEDDEGQQNANLTFVTRISALEQAQSSSVVVEIVDATDFITQVEGSLVSLHIRAGSGRASSDSVTFCKNPPFQRQRFQIAVADELLTLQQIWHLLQYTPLTIFTVQRKADGSSLVHGIGQADLSEFVEKIVQGNTQFQKEIRLCEIGEKDSVVGLLVIKVRFLGVQSIETLSREKSEQLMSQIIAFRGNQQRQVQEFVQQCQIFKQEYNNAISSVKRSIFMSLMLLRDDGELTPASLLISPIYSKQLNTAQKAYRFVQLFPSAFLGQMVNKSVFCRPFVTLSRGTASDEDKAILLCSLLRGMALPAFVASGATSEGFQYFCVVCVFGEMVQVFYRDEIFCFRRVSEGVYDLYQLTNDHPQLTTLAKFDIQSVDCLFNDQDIFVSYTANSTNLRLENRQLTGISFSLTSQSLWKRFDHQLIHDLAFNAELPPQVVSFVPIDAEICADTLEQKLWQMIAARRADVGLGTPRYEPLSRLLGQALPCFELEQMSGVIIGNEQFRLTCKNFVQEGECLIAFPLQVSGPLRFHAPSVFRAILSSEEGKRAVEAVGDGLKMGLRVYVEGYAETICAVWVIVGACYKKII